MNTFNNKIEKLLEAHPVFPTENIKRIKQQDNEAKKMIKSEEEEIDSGILSIIDTELKKVRDFVVGTRKSGENTVPYATDQVINKIAPYVDNLTPQQKEQIRVYIIKTIQMFGSRNNQRAVKSEEAEDRCKQRADSVYGSKTSAYKSGAIVRCRKSKIWKKK